MSISRRTFLEVAAAGATASLAGAAETVEVSAKGMPMRTIGRTGTRVSIVAMGGGSRFLSYETDEKAIDAMNHAIDLGISYIDTAFNYGKGKSETRVGQVMATRRKEVFLATKVPDRNGDEAMRRIEGSLKRLQTDHVDLLHIHQLMGEDDLAAIEAKDGVLKVLYKMRDEKVARNIGITCHHDPRVLKMALEHNDFDCTQMALNAALVGMMSGTGTMVINPEMKPSFESVALPAALQKKMSVIAMKVYAADGLVGQVPAEKLFRYSLSLPVRLAVVGMPKKELIGENVRMAKNFQPLPKEEMRALSNALSVKNKAALDRYFANHVDSYPA